MGGDCLVEVVMPLGYGVGRENSVGGDCLVEVVMPLGSRLKLY